MIEHHRNQRYDRAAIAVAEIDHRLRQVVVRDHDRRSLHEQRRDEIREAVRVRERDRAEVDVVGADVHGRADVRRSRRRGSPRSSTMPFGVAGRARGELDEPAAAGRSRPSFAAAQAESVPRMSRDFVRPTRRGRSERSTSSQFAATPGTSATNSTEFGSCETSTSRALQLPRSRLARARRWRQRSRVVTRRLGRR